MRIRLRSSRETTALAEISPPKEPTSINEPGGPQNGVTHRQFLKMCGLGALGGGAAILAAGAGQLVAPATPVSAQSYNEDLLVNSPYNLYVGGKVGIGATTASESLDITGGNIKLSTANSSILLYGNGAGGVIVNDNTTANSGYGQVNRNSGALSIATNKTGSGTAGPITLSPNTVEVMRIDPIGRVGIGNIAPGYTLDVLGDAKVSNHLWTNDIRSKEETPRNVLNINYDTPQNVFLFNGITSGNPTLRLYGWNPNAEGPGVGGRNNTDLAVNSAGHFAIYPNIDKHILLNVSGTGNVGIGRSTPAGKLDVGGDIFVNGTAAIGSDGVAKQCYYAQ
ncbi:MAG: hypothetical protein EPO21_12175 [Chloroflexota bacterium]|nr:MAG: hypothetical protein EPO21_12175 [Chloroflexota bacterium]